MMMSREHVRYTAVISHPKPRGLVRTSDFASIMAITSDFISFVIIWILKTATELRWSNAREDDGDGGGDENQDEGKGGAMLQVGRGSTTEDT